MKRFLDFYLAAPPAVAEGGLDRFPTLNELKNEYGETVYSTTADLNAETARLLNISPSIVYCWVYSGRRTDSSH